MVIIELNGHFRADIQNALIRKPFLTVLRYGSLVNNMVKNEQKRPPLYISVLFISVLHCTKYENLRGILGLLKLVLTIF